MFDFKIDIELYKIFYTTALLGSMTKTAKQLFMGQPAVSKAIKAIEETLGVTLFVRSPQGLVLTSEGMVLFEHISQAMEQIKIAEDSVLLMKHQSVKSVKIEICAMQYKILILPHLKPFFQQCDNINFDISPTTDSYSSLDMLDSGKIDCCLLTRPIDIDISRYKFLKLFAYNDCLMGSPEYINSIAGKGQDIVKHATLISIMNGSIMSYYEKMRLKNLHFLNKMKVTSMEHTISLAKLGCGIGFIAEELVRDELANNQLVKVDLPYIRQKREVGFLLNKKACIHDALMQFIDFYCDLYNSENSETVAEVQPV